jgi:hypothetical protein
MKIKNGYTYKTRNGSIVTAYNDYNGITIGFSPSIDGVDSWWTNLGKNWKDKESPSDAVKELYGPIPEGYIIVTKEEQQKTDKPSIKGLKFWDNIQDKWNDCSSQWWHNQLFYIKPIIPISSDVKEEQKPVFPWKQGDLLLDMKDREFRYFVAVYKNTLYFEYDVVNGIFHYDSVDNMDNYVLANTLREINVDGLTYLLYYKDGQPWLIAKPNIVD